MDIKRPLRPIDSSFGFMLHKEKLKRISENNVSQDKDSNSQDKDSNSQDKDSNSQDKDSNSQDKDSNSSFLHRVLKILRIR